MIRLLFAVLCTVLLLSPAAVAAVPSSITVQGRLTDAGGAPLAAGSKTFTFRIFDDSTGGTQTWPGVGGEQQSITSDAAGLWVGLVGAISPLTAAVFADNSLWLEIDVNGTTLPRTQFLSGPYAFRVATVDGATGGTITTQVSIGSGHTNTGNNSFVAGLSNSVTGPSASIPGGQLNSTSGFAAVISGGQLNNSTGNNSVIGGGHFHEASGASSTIAGGNDNTATGTHSTIGGGLGNTVNDSAATIAGGAGNTASADLSLVGAGAGNAATGRYSTVVGGNANVARGLLSFVGGGGGSSAALIGGLNDADSNAARGNFSAIVGGRENTASGLSSFIGGGEGNTASASDATVGGGNRNRATASYSTVAGGNLNDATGSWGTIGGGQSNTVSNSYSAVAGGHGNDATGFEAFVGGGGGNTASNLGALVTGGAINLASGFYSTVSGGVRNIASGQGSTVGGGGTLSDADSNLASGISATIPGGTRNRAGGDFSFAAGYRAMANHHGAFVWGDSTSADFTSTAADQFLIRANGGVGIGTNDPEGPLHILETSVGGITANTNSIAVFERATGGWLSLISNDGAQRGILFSDPGSPTAAGGIVFDDSQAGSDGMGFRTGGNVTRMDLDAAGNLTVDGCIDGNNTACASDRRFKQDIETLGNALATVEQLRGVRFAWRRDEFPDRNFESGPQTGVIAQEVQDVLPSAVRERRDGYLSVEYNSLIPVLIEAIKEQQKQIDDLKKTILFMTP